jgi:hypothetical protein
LEVKIVARNLKDLEAEAIEGAYSDRLSSLFGTFVSSLLQRSDERNGEQQSFEEFKRGLTFARRALELAHEAIETPPKAVSASRGKGG